MSIKQGKKYDDPASKAEIPGFIDFHKLDMSEVLLPVDEFKNFNEFFYRALKPGARPCSAPDNPHVITSPADCRSVVFNRIDAATNIWIKGRDFSVKRLLGDAYPEDAAKYENGALGIFRLAPQDYHRFHIPVDGVLRKPKLIAGEYYTVNPMAIRSALDVYGENVRVIVPIDTVAHGRVMVICVGAMMVGSTVITRQEGEQVKRAEELGYFKFGGSTIVLLFEEGKMVFDDDLVDNSNGALETLVRTSPVPLPFEVFVLVLIVNIRFVWACRSVTLLTTRNTRPISAKMPRTSQSRRSGKPRDVSKVATSSKKAATIVTTRRQRAKPRPAHRRARDLGRGGHISGHIQMLSLAELLRTEKMLLLLDGQSKGCREKG